MGTRDVDGTAGYKQSYTSRSDVGSVDGVRGMASRTS